MTSSTRAFMVAVAFAIVGLPACAGADGRRPVCLSEDETREAMQNRKLVPPVRAVDAALTWTPGESVTIRLCRSDPAMIYDVLVLRRDGRLVHVLVDAGSGKLLAPQAGQ